MPKLVFWGGRGGKLEGGGGGRSLQFKISLHYSSYLPKVQILTYFHKNLIRNATVIIFGW